jgi:hypothetical protein
MEKRTDTERNILNNNNTTDIIISENMKGKFC